MEWRNIDGFDKGLKTPYNTNFNVGGSGTSAGRRTTRRACWSGTATRRTRSTTSATTSTTRRASAPKGRSCSSTRTSSRRACAVRRRRRTRALLDNLNSRAQAADVAFGTIELPVPVLLPVRSDDQYATACNWFGARASVDDVHRRSDVVSGSGVSTGPRSGGRRCSSATSTHPRSSRRRQRVLQHADRRRDGKLIPDLFGSTSAAATSRHR